jgi:hypothetical protein
MAAVVAKKSPPRRTFVGDELLLRLKFFASRRTYGVPQVVDGRLDLDVGLTDEHLDEVVPFAGSNRYHDVINGLDVTCVAVHRDGAARAVALARRGSRWVATLDVAGVAEVRAAASGARLRPLDVLPTALEVGEATAAVRDVALGGLRLRVAEVYGFGVSRFVWNGGVVLAAYLGDAKKRKGLAGRSLVDLGSGTGVVALAASALGARVVATDRGDALAGLADLATRAPGVAVEALDFGDAPGPLVAAAAPTIACAADVLYPGYDFDVVPLLWRTLAALPSVDEFYLAFSHRDENSTPVTQLLMDCLRPQFPTISVCYRVENLVGHHSVIRFKK